MVPLCVGPELQPQVPAGAFAMNRVKENTQLRAFIFVP
jgi:hypothetical protein